MKHILIQSIPFTIAVFLLNACGGGTSVDTALSTNVTTLGKVTFTNVQPGTNIAVKCDDGYVTQTQSTTPIGLNYKDSEDKEEEEENNNDNSNTQQTEEIKIDLPEKTTCQLAITTYTPCYKEMIINLDENDGKFNLNDFYKQDCMTPPTPTPTPMPTRGMSNGLENWKQPRVYAKVDAQPACNQDKIFSLRPHNTSINTRFVDYTSTPMHPEGHTLRATQTRNANDSIPLTYDATTKTWKNDCAPITYVDKKDIYPSYWVEAVNDANGSVVTKDRITVYDGGTDNCMACHASNSGYPLAYAKNNPANLADPEADYKTNILRKHDEEYPNVANKYMTQLQAKGLNYNPAGLEATSKTMKVSCTDCHGINAVQGSGFKTVPSLTNAIHDLHANLSEPNIAGANNCLTCHPGETISKTFNGKIVHPFTAQWADEDGHGNWTENRGAASCTLCHGPDLRGTKISNNTSCYKCHGKEWNTPQIGTKPVPTNNGKILGTTLSSIVNSSN